jgi:hypothetical protein
MGSCAPKFVHLYALPHLQGSHATASWIILNKG